MARIAIVETYPYEAAWGGEAVYIDRIRQFLVDRGHEVESIITDVSRGRASPFVRLRSGAAGRQRWVVRRALRCGEGRFLSCEPILFLRAAGSALGIRSSRDGRSGEGERRWLLDRLSRTGPDVVILTFGAARFSRDVAGADRLIVAIRGFFSERVMRLDEAGASIARSAVAAETEDLSAATLACLNNASDLDHYRSTTGAANGALIGMGFPRRRRAAPGTEPVLLFVGARTKPNIQALRWFFDHCWTRVVAAVPASRLRVVGTVAGAFGEAGLPNVELVGFSDDLDAEYGLAQLVIAPLLVGTNGVKTKIAEALAYGRPLVSTSIGVDPADPGQFGDAVEVADEPGAFAAAVIRLLTDAPLRRARSAAAEEQFERHFCEEVAYGPLIRMLAPLEAGHR